MTEEVPFGKLLKQLRKRADMTQHDLAAALNYSASFIASLEKAQRQPDIEVVIAKFIPALGLQDDRTTAARLIERAAAARGEHAPPFATSGAISHRIIQPKPQPHLGYLPPLSTELLGREQVVNLLCNRLLGHHGRMLTLVGPPGIGKTRLALAVAARLQQHYPDGTFFVPLAGIRESTLMVATIIAALGIHDATPKPHPLRLIEHLRDKTMLLVLDHCEQIREASLLLATALAKCPGVHILATSHVRLHLRAEQRYRVPRLELGSAVALFAQRARAVSDEFELSEANRPTLNAICQSLDRLPLAIELYAPQIEHFSLTQLAKQLRIRRLELLVDGAADLPPRHRTLREAIQSSYALLSERERTLFRHLGVFAGGFDLAAIAAIDVWKREFATPVDYRQGANVDQQALHTLITKGLVRVETMPFDEQRFFLLESIREFALEQLRAQGEEHLLR